MLERAQMYSSARDAAREISGWVVCKRRSGLEVDLYGDIEGLEGGGKPMPCCDGALTTNLDDDDDRMGIGSAGRWM